MPRVKQLVLTVAWLALVGCATTEDARSAGEQIEDTVTLSRVKTALLRSDDTDGTRIAEGIDGVRSVKNNLELLPESP